MTGSPARHLLSICTTCRVGAGLDETRDGRRLFDLIEPLFTEFGLEDIALGDVECMSGCNRACTISLAGPAKPSYFFGDLRPDPATAEQIITLAKQYRDTPDGVLARKERPQILRSGILAKLPAAPSGEGY